MSLLEDVRLIRPIERTISTSSISARGRLSHEGQAVVQNLEMQFGDQQELFETLLEGSLGEYEDFDMNQALGVFKDSAINYVKQLVRLGKSTDSDWVNDPNHEFWVSSMHNFGHKYVMMAREMSRTNLEYQSISRFLSLAYIYQPQDFTNLKNRFPNYTDSVILNAMTSYRTWEKREEYFSGIEKNREFLQATYPDLSDYIINLAVFFHPKSCQEYVERFLFIHETLRNEFADLDDSIVVQIAQNQGDIENARQKAEAIVTIIPKLVEEFPNTPIAVIKRAASKTTKSRQFIQDVYSQYDLLVDNFGYMTSEAELLKIIAENLKNPKKALKEIETKREDLLEKFPDIAPGYINQISLRYRTNPEAFITGLHSRADELSERIGIPPGRMFTLLLANPNMTEDDARRYADSYERLQNQFPDLNSTSIMRIINLSEEEQRDYVQYFKAEVSNLSERFPVFNIGTIKHVVASYDAPDEYMHESYARFQTIMQIDAEIPTWVATNFAVFIPNKAIKRAEGFRSKYNQLEKKYPGYTMTDYSTAIYQNFDDPETVFLKNQELK